MTPLGFVIDEPASRIGELADRHGLRIVSRDLARPWGAWFPLDEADLGAFTAAFFPALKPAPANERARMSPKLLAIAPGRRVSWQYHHRRSELWRVVEGPVGVIRSDTDDEGELAVQRDGDLLQLALGERHRLVGLDDWAIVAEIWVHEVPGHPTDEDDTVRVRDDYGR